MEVITNKVSFKGRSPDIDNSTYIDPSAKIIREESIAKYACVWTGAVLRGGENLFRITNNIG